MPKRPAHHRVKRHEVYSLAEAGETAGVHRKTVARWVRDGGLPADTSRKPWLIRGEDLKTWLIRRRDKGKRPLENGFIYCLPCRAAHMPDGAIADFKQRTERSGLLIGLCPSCGRLMHRIVRNEDLAQKAAGIQVAFR